MSELETPSAAAPATKPAKTAKKAAKKTATRTAAADSTATKSIHELSVEDLDREIKEIELETKRVQLAQARQGIQKFNDDEATKKRKADSAQRALRAEAYGKKITAEQCVHKLGGYGNEDTYNGDDKPSIVVTDLPIPGMRLVMCVRCPKEWRSPDPRLKKSDPETWAEQAAEWKEALMLMKNSRSKAMGGPTFGFETMDGAPIHPVIL